MKAWVPFKLWPAQRETLAELHEHKRLVALKARQLGFTWLFLAYALWLLLFQPAATVLLFSKRDEEAIELLDFRLKGMYERLPSWMQVGAEMDAKHQWLLGNGSRAMAFPATGGRSYTGTFVLMDEVEFVADYNGLISAVQPTVDAGGYIVQLSTVEKDQPLSGFKRTYQAAKAGENSYHAVFHGWRARPDRDDAWYEARKRDILSRTGALDELFQEYPDTDREALQPNTQDKRIPPAWLEACFTKLEPLQDAELAVLGTPAIPGLVVYRAPKFGVEYRGGADPAEGNVNSDDSALTIVDHATGEEVARLAGKYEPGVFAGHSKSVAAWYNHARLLVERNNHGHAVILWFSQNGYLSYLIDGLDGKTGWLTTAAAKTAMYDLAADAFRQGDARLHSEETYMQLAHIDANKLEAPEGMYDDLATAYVLALTARGRGAPASGQSNYLAGDGWAADDDE
jgi:hypothetical protein